MEIWWQQDVQLYQQILSAAHSIEKIRKNKVNESIVGIFCYVQLLLSCVGNISKLLQNNNAYREHLNLDLDRIPNISYRFIRNMNEHIDERINNPVSISLFYSDMSLRNKRCKDNDISIPQRNFVIDCEMLEFIDSRNGLMTVKIEDVEHELNYLSKLKPIAYVVERYSGFDKIF